MTSTGAISPNFHEGARSEYLAHYVFSAFGTSIPTPRPEDYGVDLFCTLGHRIGQRFHIDSYYYVQVKSVKEDLVFNDAKSIEWLTSLISPLLLAFVDKESGNIKIYASLGISMLYAKLGLTSVKLIPESIPPALRKHTDPPFHPCVEHKNNVQVDIYLGEPIAEFKITKLQDRNFIKKIERVLRSWIEIDQENINHKSMGYTFFGMPTSYKKNEVANIDSTVGNFTDSLNNSKIAKRHVDSLLKGIAQQLFIAAKASNIVRWGALHDAALEIAKNNTDMLHGPGFFVLYGALLTRLNKTLKIDPAWEIYMEEAMRKV